MVRAGNSHLLFLHATLTDCYSSRITVPTLDGALGLGWVNLILAHTSRWSHSNPSIPSINKDHFEQLLYFVAVFAGFWPSRNERLKFAWSQVIVDPSPWVSLQVQLRYFSAVERLTKGAYADGLLCHREQGQIVSDALGVRPHYFEERRISVFGRLLAQNPWYTFLPPYYSVVVVGESSFGELDHYNLKWRPGLEGTIAFQLAVLTSIDVWETEWNKSLDHIDECLNFQLNQTLDPAEIDKWMFDDNFERSRLYFTILQILRLFGSCIGTILSDDLRPLDDVFLKDPNFPLWEMKEDELHVLRSNWELIRETQRKAEKSLSDRISYKTTEVESLRDGVCYPTLNDQILAVPLISFFIQLFNASSLRETNSSSTMGRYVLIFTVVTVLYLPPTFISVCRSLLSLERTLVSLITHLDRVRLGYIPKGRRRDKVGVQSGSGVGVSTYIHRIRCGCHYCVQGEMERQVLTLVERFQELDINEWQHRFRHKFAS